MRFLLLTLALLFLSCTQGRPPRRQHQDQPSQPDTVTGGGNGTKDWDLGIEYNRYLQEIVQVLESDPAFRKKLEEADVEKIRDGSIANELDFVNHNVRSKLDDIKRRELERLRHLAMRQFELSEGIDKRHLKIPSHVEIQSPTFEKDDLIKLIKSTTSDLEEADKNRREEFKRYEMEKKFEEQERLNHIEDEEKRKEEQSKLKALEDKHRKHATPHHPMTKDQLEQVWEESDHMRPEDWDPKTFFAMHDLNGDHFWDQDEIRALFKKELDKVYDPNAPEDDMKERAEEMERMREHVFKESDKNKDMLISYEEFLTETKRDEFEKDPGWNTLDQDEKDDFSDDEFRAYEMQRQREIQDMLNRGIVPPGYPYYGDIPQGGAPFRPPPMPGYGAQPQMGIPGQAAYNPQYQQQQYQGNQQYQGQQQPYQGQQQKFAGGHPQQQQQFGGQQQQQFAGQQQQLGGKPPQQQQQFSGQKQFSGQQQQFAAQQPGQPQAQQQPPAQPQGQQQFQGQQQPQVQQQFQGQQQPQAQQQPQVQQQFTGQLLPEAPQQQQQQQQNVPVVQSGHEDVAQQHQQAQVQLNP